MTKSDFDFLTNSGVKIKQTQNGYHFTSDAIQLAGFVKCSQTDTVIDAGCGGCVISLIVNDNHKPKTILAVDIHPEAITLANENIALNNITNIQTHCADIREFHKTYGANRIDVLVCNPPYFSSGKKSENTVKATARHNDTLSLDDLCSAATKLLKYSGDLYLCYPSSFTAHAIATLESHNFRVKQLKFISNKKEIYLTLFHARKGGGHSTKICLPTETLS